MSHEFKMRVPKQVQDILLGPGVEVVNAQDLTTFLQEALAEVGTNEPCPSGHQKTNMV